MLNFRPKRLPALSIRNKMPKSLCFVDPNTHSVLPSFFNQYLCVVFVSFKLPHWKKIHKDYYHTHFYDYNFDSYYDFYNYDQYVIIMILSTQ